MAQIPRLRLLDVIAWTVAGAQLAPKVPGRPMPDRAERCHAGLITQRSQAQVPLLPGKCRSEADRQRRRSDLLIVVRGSSAGSGPGHLAPDTMGLDAAARRSAAPLGPPWQAGRP